MPPDDTTRGGQGWLARLVNAWSQFFPAGSLRAALVSGSFWSLAGAVCSRGLAVVASVLVARILGKEAFGQFGIVLVVVSTFAQFASFGISMTATKFVAEFRATDPARAGRVLSFCGVIALIGIALASLACMIAATWIANGLYDAPALIVPLMFGSTLVAMMLANLMAQGALAGFEDFRGISTSNVVQGAILLAGAIPLSWWLGLNGAVLAMSISHAAAAAYCLAAIARKCRDYGMPLRLRGIWEERVLLWQYAMPSLLTAGVTGPSVMLSQALAALAPGGVAGLGGFQAAEQWRSAALFIPQAMRRVTLPMLCGLRGAGDHRRFMKALWANLLLNMAVTIAASIPIILLSPWIMSAYGEGFREDWDILVILVGTSVIYAILHIETQVTACMGKLWWDFAMHVAWGIALLAGSALLIPMYGVRGYAWAYVGSFTVHAVLNGIAAVVWVRQARAAARQRL